MVTPSDPAEVIRAGGVRVGFGAGDVHGAAWEQGGARKSLLDTLADLRGQLAAILGGP